MSASKKLIPLTGQFTRLFSQTSRKQAEHVQEVVSSRFQRLKENQKRFQIEDGVPVYLKKGFPDRVLFGFTCVYTAGMLAWTVNVWIKLINRK